MTKKISAFFTIILFVFSLQLYGKEVKVVSLAPSITETLFAIGLSEKEIVGVTNYCDYPKEASKILKVGSLTTLSIEKIVSLEPDYLFSIGSENSPLNAQLKKAGINVVVFNPRNIDGIFSTIIKIGEIVHKERESKEVVRRMSEKLKEIRGKVRTIKNKKKIYVEIWDDPITSCGKGSLIDEVVNLAGGINITGNINAAYPIVSPEVIIRENPDVIILGYMSRDQKNAINTVLNRFGWRDVSAIKTKNIICNIDTNILLRPSPRIIDGIEQIYNKVYGNR